MEQMGFILSLLFDQVPFAELSSRVISGVLQTFRLVPVIVIIFIIVIIIIVIIIIIIIIIIIGLGEERLLPGSREIFCQRRL